MSTQVSQRLVRSTTAFAAMIALAVFLTIPTVFFLTAISHENNRLQGEAEATAARLSQAIYSTPSHWQYQFDRLEELLRPPGYDDRLHQNILSPDGTEIVFAGRPPAFPSLQSRAMVSDGHNLIAIVTTSKSIWPLIRQTGAAMALSTLLGSAIFIALNTLLRALRRMVSVLEQSEIELRAARDAAEIANISKSEFLANMSHELRTPLNAVIGFSAMIENETYGPVGSPKYLGYATDIRDSGQHLLELINDILDLSKVESGIDELYDEDIDVAQVLRSVHMLISERAAVAGIRLVFDHPNGLPRLRADCRKLKQILLNLLTNAIKFTEAPGRVTLSARCQDGGGYIFQVIDTGIGMTASDIPKALSRFGQIGGGLARRYEGTGLGLPLTKSLIEQHDGSMTLQSELGVGTTVAICFPAQRTVQARPACEITSISPQSRAI